MHTYQMHDTSGRSLKWRYLKKHDVLTPMKRRQGLLLEAMDGFLTQLKKQSTEEGPSAKRMKEFETFYQPLFSMMRPTINLI